MKTLPHYTQHDVMDCGPTCLRMVAAYYDKRYSLEGLREKSFITREGVSMLGISEAAEKIGFRSICVQVGYEKLQEAPLPCIIHWNQQHFVVVYKLNDRYVWVADPGAGKLKYTKEEFLAEFPKERRRHRCGVVAGAHTRILYNRGRGRRSESQRF